MSKISADHSSRAAYVYVRQSTSDQLTNNPESRRRQYALADRARTLGWSNVRAYDAVELCDFAMLATQLAKVVVCVVGTFLAFRRAWYRRFRQPENQSNATVLGAQAQ